MGRKVLAVVTALITAWGTILVGKMIATKAGFSTPNNLGSVPRADVIDYFSSQPVSEYVGLLIASVVGAFFAGYIVTSMSRRESPGIRLTLVVGMFLILGGLINFILLLPGQPVWLVVSTLAMYIPVALLGREFSRLSIGLRGHA